jgi:hypothetical protein
MTWESWFKIGLSALPTSFTIFGLWLYWGDNPLPVLAPSLGFWGVVIAFYLFTHIYVENSRAPFFFATFTACLWLVSAITAHNLGQFLRANQQVGVLRLFKNKDFWYAYAPSTLSLGTALWQFLLHEPRIVREIEGERTSW